MTIKKPISVKRPSKPEAADGATTENASTNGGATIADRFKLDMTDPAAKKSAPAGAGAVAAVIAAVAGLIVAGVLTYVLWQHWSFLMPA